MNQCHENAVLCTKYKSAVEREQIIESVMCNPRAINMTCSLRMIKRECGPTSGCGHLFCTHPFASVPPTSTKLSMPLIVYCLLYRLQKSTEQLDKVRDSESTLRTQLQYFQEVNCLQSWMMGKKDIERILTWVFWILVSW